MGTPNHCGVCSKVPRNVTSTFFNTVYLLPNDLGFEHGLPKLLLAPDATKPRYTPARNGNKKVEELTKTVQYIHVINYQAQIMGWMHLIFRQIIHS